MLQVASFDLAMSQGFRSPKLGTFNSKPATFSCHCINKRQKRGNVGSYKLLVVSDGEAGDQVLNRASQHRDGSPKPGVLEDVKSRGIIIDAIGLDMQKDHPLSKEINGKYMRGDDPASLAKAIQSAVAEVGFAGPKDASEEAFQIVQELPETFTTSALKGLTIFANQPIGEKYVAPQPPVTKTSMVEPQQDGRQLQPQVQDGNITGLICFSAFVAMALIAIFGILTIASRQTFR